MKFNKCLVNKKTILYYLPLILIELYLLMTLLLFEFGTIEWPITNKSQLYFFIFLYHFAFIIGYILNIKDYFIFSFKFKKLIEDKFKKEIIYIKNNKVKLFKYYISIGIFILIIVNYFRLARVVNSMNIVDMIKYVYYALFNSKEFYQFKFSLNQDILIGGRIITMLTTLLSPIYWPIYPMGIYFFRKISINKRILFCISIILELCYGISIGTNKVIFDIVIIIFSILVIKGLQKVYRSNVNKNHICFLIISIFFACIIILIFFDFTMLSRLGGMDRFNNGFMPGINVNVDKGIIKYLPVSFQFLLTMICGYLTQGYFGMSLALKLPFISCYGLGNNNFILSNFEEMFNLSIRSNMYQYRISEYSWGATQNWHTFYTWIANDVSFYGVIIIMFILGIVLSKVWRDALVNKNIFAICLLPMFVILFIFIPCNNQIFSLPTTFMPFFSLFICWILTRKEDKNEE